MKALCWHGTGDVRVDTVPDPKIEDPRDAIVRITSTAHLRLRPAPLDGFMPTMEKGDILGHEPMGDRRGGRQRRQEAEEGRPRRRPVHHLLRRLLVLQEDSCSRCCDTSNPNAEIAREGDGPLARPGCSASRTCSAAYAGGQAEYLRVPYADVGPIKIESDLPDEKVLFLSDIFPTGYMAAENAEIEPGDTVAVWGCGPVGQFAIKSAWMLGAGRVIAIDPVPERLQMAREQGKAETINFRRRRSTTSCMEMTKGRGPDRCIDAVGCEAHADGQPRRGGRQGEGGGDDWPPTGRTSCGRRSCAAARAARSRSPASTSGSRDKIPFGAVHEQGADDEDGPDARASATSSRCLKKIEAGEIDPSFVITHKLPLDDGPEAYKTFRDKKDGCIKVVLKPWGDVR